MSIFEFDGPPSWFLDASEPGESTKCPWEWVVEGTAGGKNRVGDVHRTLCKQKQTSALCATNGDRNTSNRLWTCLYQQIRLEHFEIISSMSIST